MTVLLDANVLIALVVGDHIHHDAAETWLAGTEDVFATCPITQGSLIRLLIREGQTAATARAAIAGLDRHARHEFWPDSVSYGDVSLDGVAGHRQVTDTYLVALVRARAGRLATFDRGLAAQHTTIVDLVPIA